MAPDSEGNGNVQGFADSQRNGTNDTRTHAKENGEEDDDTGEEEDDDDEEEEEPRLKYQCLTKGQAALYRNGDAASASLVTGDKMVGKSSIAKLP